MREQGGAQNTLCQSPNDKKGRNWMRPRFQLKFYFKSVSALRIGTILLLPALWRGGGPPTRLRCTRLLLLCHGFLWRARRLAVGRFGSRGSRSSFPRSRFHQCSLALADEGQAVVRFVPVDAYQVAQIHLIGREKISQRVDHVALDGPLQVARAVAMVRAFLQKEFSSGRSHAEKKLAFGRI